MYIYTLFNIFNTCIYILSNYFYIVKYINIYVNIYIFNYIFNCINNIIII